MFAPEVELFHHDWSEDDRLTERIARTHDAGFVATELLREARVGRYLEEEKVRDFDFSSRLRPEWLARAGFVRKVYLNNIQQYGKEGLVHLCPEVGEYYELMDDRFIRTITELAEKIKDGTLKMEYDRKHPEKYEPGNYSERRIIWLYRE